MPIHLIPGTKQASDSLAQTRAIMDTIYQENPAHWPHGVSPEMCDGGCWLVREASSQAPVGFAGWQERHEGFKKIGYYAIGILPEWRNQGLARQAVRQVIGAKSAGVDAVKAFIVPGNAPSIALAESLGVPVVKMAFLKMLTSGPAKAVGGAGLSAAFWDQIYNATSPQPKAWNEWDGARTRMALTNGIFGGAAGMGGGASMLKGLATMPAKDVQMAAAAGLPSFFKSLAGISTAAGEQAKATAANGANAGGMSTPMKWGLGTLGLGAGALGLGALLNSMKHTNAVQEIADASDKGRVRVKLPTSKPGDQETEIDMPFEQMDISNALRGAIARDTKRRLRSESASRVMHRGTRSTQDEPQTATITA